MTPITTMPSGGAALFWGIITFSLLILLHEGGHFVAARLFGVKVHEFMLGLPGPALTWRSKRSGVRYGVTMIPLGGYVRIAGMEPGAEDPLLAAALGVVVARARTDAADLARALSIDNDHASSLLTTLEDYGACESPPKLLVATPVVAREQGESDDALLARVRSHVFRGQSAWKRITILSMGVLVNLVTAVLVFTVVLSAWGYAVSSEKPVLGAVAPGSAAAQAGLKSGDVVVALDGVAVKTWEALRTAIRAHAPGQAIALDVRRGGQPLVISATAASSPGSSTVGYLGISPALERVHFTVLGAVGESVRYIGLTFVAVADFFNPAKFSASVSNARSVVGVSYMVAQAAETDPIEYAALIALLSLSLGVMNILPIPPLDGGKIASELVQAVVRRPIPRRLSLAFSAMGAVLLFSLVFYLMYADVVRYIINPG